MSRATAELSYRHGASEEPLLGDTIGANLAATAARVGDAEALVEVWTARRWSYSELEAWARQVARGLLGAGLAPGDRVGIWSPNCAEWLAVQYGTALAGLVLVNLNPAYRTTELAYALRQSGARLLVSATTFKTSDYRGMVEAVRAEGGAPALEDVVWLGEESWDALVAAGADPALDDALDAVTARLSCDDPVNIQYTSGTTGFPKGATLSHHNLLNNGHSIGRLLGYSDVDRICVPVPFYHCFGMVIANLAAATSGAAVVMPSPMFDPGATLAAVQSERCTSLYGVPTMFIAELAHPSFPDTDVSSLRTGVMAGSPCPVEVMKRVIDEMHMPEVAICYGMTETSPVSTQTRVDDDLDRRTATVGRVMPHLEVKVVDAEGRTVPVGTPGELCTRGYSVMLGYWDEPGRTAEAIDAARWMHTGDLAVMREDGYVNIVGRIKDLVIRGGENVYPREVEEALYAHPDIVDVQVVGVPDERYGEELAAWVRMAPGAGPLDADTLRAWCEGRIARHKIPRYVRVVEEFPMTVTGKVRKVEMRELSIELWGLQAAAAVDTA
jgi:fatty-acyl-CoA synthase